MISGITCSSNCMSQAVLLRAVLANPRAYYSTVDCILVTTTRMTNTLSNRALDGDRLAWNTEREPSL